MRQFAPLIGLRWCGIVPLLLAGGQAGPAGALAQSAAPDPPATVVAGDNSALDVRGAVAGATPLATTTALNAAFSYAAKAGYQTVNLAANATYNIASIGDLAEDGQPTALKIGGASGFTLDCHGATLVLNTAGRNTFAKSLWIGGGSKSTRPGPAIAWYFPSASTTRRWYCGTMWMTVRRIRIAMTAAKMTMARPTSIRTLPSPVTNPLVRR